MKEVKSNTISLSSLPSSFFEDKIYTYLSKYGEINRLKLVRSKKIAYIEFKNRESACQVLKSVDNTSEVDERYVSIEAIFTNWKYFYKRDILRRRGIRCVRKRMNTASIDSINSHMKRIRLDR